MADLVAGEEAWIEGEGGLADGLNDPVADDARIALTVSPEARAPRPAELLYPARAVLVLGIGAERGAPPDEAVALAEATLAQAGYSPLALAAVASLDLKADEPAVHAVARHFGVPARFFDAARLEQEAPRLANPSDVVFRETGCHGVAEGAALAGAGEGGELVAPKRKSARATAAIARAPRPLAVERIGRARGTLFVVGIGPGSEAWRSPEVSRMVAGSTDLVGYSLYLDLLGPAGARQGAARFRPRRRRGAGAPCDGTRRRRAHRLAGLLGRRRHLCHGDVVFELMDRGGVSDGARRIAVEVSPGISALQAAAARAGAPLGHDFCTISLSDLLTPWADISDGWRRRPRGIS